MSARNTIERSVVPGRAGFAASRLPQDVLAGLTLAAIAIPEQMATARLAHFPPEAGFLAFIAATLGFLIFGASRVMSVGADSTISPIFAAGLVLFAAQGSSGYATLAAALAMMVGVLVGVSGFCRMGWVSNLLSAPVTIGFLAGIAVHIAASQLPVLCGLPPSHVGALAGLIHTDFRHANIYDVALGAGVFLITATAEVLDRRWPGALLGVVAATVITIVFALDQHGVQLLGAIAMPRPHLPLPWPDLNALVRLAPLALLLALVVMVQSAAVSGSFASDEPADVNRDFMGVGAANILAGLCGAFPVNASPPRTAVVSEAGGRSKAAGMTAAIAVAVLAIFGSGLLKHVPAAALAGILFFIAVRIVRFDQARAVWLQSRPEFLLMVATALAILVFPIEIGVGVGILFSLLHGMWTTTRAQVITLSRIVGTSIWWPPMSGVNLQDVSGVLVLAFQAPLSFLNAGAFRRGVAEILARAPAPPRLVVLEASSIVEIDYTAAHVLCAAVKLCQARGAVFAVARLESIRAQKSFHRFGITEMVGPSHIFRSVQEAVNALATAPDAASNGHNRET